jgi:hypothetical protein
MLQRNVLCCFDIIKKRTHSNINPFAARISPGEGPTLAHIATLRVGTLGAHTQLVLVIFDGFPGTLEAPVSGLAWS